MNFNILSIQKRWIVDLVELSNKHLGVGYLTMDYFDTVIKSPSYNGYVVFNRQNQLIAFLVSYKTCKSEVLEKLTDTTISEVLDTKIICIDTIVVASEYQNRGIGENLIEYIIAKSIVSSGFIMYAWKYRNRINLKNIAERLFFIPIKEYADLWKKECELKRFSCPSKTEGANCSCSTILYYLKAKV